MRGTISISRGGASTLGRSADMLKKKVRSKNGQEPSVSQPEGAKRNRQEAKVERE